MLTMNLVILHENDIHDLHQASKNHFFFVVRLAPYAARTKETACFDVLPLFRKTHSWLKPFKLDVTEVPNFPAIVDDFGRKFWQNQEKKQ